MKLSPDTIEILNNFSSINPSIILRPGNVIRVGTPDLAVFAQAKIAETFDREVGIYQLKKFLGVLSLFQGEPDIELHDTFIKISNDRQSMNFVVADMNLIKASPDKEPNVPAPAATFKVLWNDLSTCLKAVAVIDAPHISFVGNGETISIVGSDPKNSSKDRYSVVIGQTDQNFTTRLLKSSFKMMPRDYEVSVHDAYAKFAAHDVTYWLPAAAE